MTGLTSAALFCGAGGDISGFVEAGIEVVLGANHWARAIETVSANHPTADFLCTDINNYDMRRLPRTDILWASVLCTEASPSGGNKKRHGQGHLDFEEQGHVPAAGWERTRACALDVIRAVEVHRYKAVVVENVVEFARDWELYEWWIDGMCKLRPGYNVQVVNVSAAHVHGDSNAPAPQWRDRIFIVFTRKGVPAPVLRLRPPSWCERCENLVDGEQRWKKPTGRYPVGKYGQQYLYHCPRDGSVVEPLVLPAIAAIDIDDIGERIGDRKRPLAANTMARIEWGIRTFVEPALMVNSNHDDTRVYPFVVVNRTNNRAWPASDPLAPVTTADSQALVQPFVTVLKNHGKATGVIDEPLATIETSGTHHYLTTPPGAFVFQNAYGQHDGRAFPVDGAPLHTVTTTSCGALAVPPGAHLPRLDWNALVIPYRRGRAKRASEPLHTIATKPGEALVQPSIDVMDCYYRMLRPREHCRAQRFWDDYIMTGNIGEQTAQAGNAVPVNVAHWIGDALMTALG